MTIYMDTDFKCHVANKKFYKDAETARRKLDVFFAANRLTDDAYMELTAMTAEMYA